jgi:hypothetical protein
LAYKYTPEELETYINYNNASDECHIYTCNKAIIKKLDEYVKKFPNEYKLDKQDNCSKSYITNKKYITIRSPKTMTAKQKAQLQLNAKKMLEARENSSENNN